MDYKASRKVLESLPNIYIPTNSGGYVGIRGSLVHWTTGLDLEVLQEIQVFLQ